MKLNVLRSSSLRGVLFLLLCIVGMGNVWGEKYQLITSTNELVAGCRYIIASMTDGSGAVMKNYVSGENNWKQVETSATNSDITYQNGMARFTLGGSSDSWTFHNGSYYLNATDTDKNYLKGSTSTDKYAKFKISFNNGAAIITCKGKTTRNILQYNSTSEIFSCYNNGNQKAVYLYKELPVSSISISGNPTNTQYYVGETPSAEGLTVTATYSDNSTEDVTASAKWTFDPAIIGQNTTSVIIRADYGGKWNEETYNISTMSIANTESTAYSVAVACSRIDYGKGLAEEVYVKGTVSKIESYDATSGSITYWISDDGTTTSKQFMCDGGLDTGNGKFQSINDLKLGTVVVVKGLMKKDGNIYKFATGNTIISKDETNTKALSAIKISGTPSKTTYHVGDVPSADGLKVIATYSNSDTVDVTKDANWTFTPETISESTTQVKVKAEYHEFTSEYDYDVSVSNKIIYYERLKDGKMYYIGATVGGTDYYFCTTYTSTTESAKGVAQEEKSQGTIVKAIANKNDKTKWAFQFSNGYYLSLADAQNNGYVKITNNAAYWTLSNTTNNLIKMSINDYCLQRNSISSNLIFGSYDNTQINVWFMEVPTHNISITDAGYATFCLPYHATVPDGLTAYTAIDCGEYIKLTAKANRKIAAGEGVVLQGNQGTYTFVAAEGSVKATEGNQLVGVTEDTQLSASDNAYMLTRKKDDGTIAFRLLGTNYTLGANKAYLKLTNNNACELIPALWDDNITNIVNTNKNEEVLNHVIYNITGQKLSRIQKGINIINGKLVIKE